MKNVLFDLVASQPCGSVLAHGAGEYVKAVVHSVLRRKTNQNIVFFCDAGRPLDPAVRAGAAAAGCEILEMDPDRDLHGVLAARKFDLFYSALFRSSYLNLQLGSTPFLLTIHGLRGIEMARDRTELRYPMKWRKLPGYLYRTWFPRQDVRRKTRTIAAICNRAQRMVVPSNHTKHALLALIPGCDPGKVTVVYSPRKQPSPAPTADFPARLGLAKGNYLLLVSVNGWIKNAYRAMQAIDGLYSLGADIPARTLLLGATSPRLLRYVRNKSRFVPHGYVGEADLEACYRDAGLFIYPTLNEGFGYPPLEAMKHGTPVAASAISSVPEICGDAALYFNPLSVMEMQTRILQCFTQPGLLETLRAKGPAHAARMGWEQDRMLAEFTETILN